MQRLFKRILGEISLKTLLVSLFFLLAIFIFGFLADKIANGNEASFDERVFSFFKTDPSSFLFAIMKSLTFFGSAYFLIPAYIILIIFLVVKNKRPDAINVAIVGITSTGLMFILKEFFHRKRPDLPLLKTITNFSFPSGHALCSFIFCSIVIYLIDKSKLGLVWKWVWSVLLVLFSITIGISRVVLRYHYASDVLAGFCLGFAWVIFSLWMEKKLTGRRTQQQPSV